MKAFCRPLEISPNVRLPFFSYSRFLCGQKRCIDSDEFVHNKTHNLHGMAGLPRFISAQTFYTLYNNYFNKFSMNP